MGKCDSVIRQLRFVIKDEITECYVIVDAIGDCPIGIQGSHHKTFPASMSAIDILQSNDFKDFLLWSLQAPE